MADYPYILNTGTIKSFFDHIQERGLPDKVNQRYLTSMGFTSSNDRPIIQIAKHLKFLDSSGAPTELWRGYRNRSAAKMLMAKAITGAYSDLYKSYPQAQSVSDELIRNFISVNSSSSSTTATRAVRTFKSLCELAEFGGDASTTEEDGRPEGRFDSGTKPDVSRQSANSYPDVHIDVQTHIDSTASPEQIDQIFASMARHLYRRDDS